MEPSQTNAIQITGLKRNRFVGQFIKQQIEKWIDRKRSLLFLPKSTLYSAHLDWDEEANLYSFNIKIQIGSQVWENRTCDRSSQNAVLIGLKGLRPKQGSAWTQDNMPTLSKSVA